MKEEQCAAAGFDDGPAAQATCSAVQQSIRLLTWQLLSLVRHGSKWPITDSLLAIGLYVPLPDTSLVVVKWRQLPSAQHVAFAVPGESQQWAAYMRNLPCRMVVSANQWLLAD
jgi:hypothetical protein